MNTSEPWSWQRSSPQSQSWVLGLEEAQHSQLAQIPLMDCPSSLFIISYCPLHASSLCVCRHCLTANEKKQYAALGKPKAKNSQLHEASAFFELCYIRSFKFVHCWGACLHFLCYLLTMLAALPHCLLILIISHLQCTSARTTLSTRNTDSDGTTFLWLPQDDYSGSSFFEYVGWFCWHGRRLIGLGQPLGFLHWWRPDAVSDEVALLVPY